MSSIKDQVARRRAGGRRSSLKPTDERKKALTISERRRKMREKKNKAESKGDESKSESSDESTGGTEIVIEESSLSEASRPEEEQSIASSSQQDTSVDGQVEEDDDEEEEESEEAESDSKDEGEDEEDEDDEDDDEEDEEEEEDEEVETYKTFKNFTSQTGVKLRCIIPSRIWITGALVPVSVKITHNSDRVIKAMQLYMRTTYSFPSGQSDSFCCGLLTHSDKNSFPIVQPSKYETKIEYTIPQNLIQPTSEAFSEFYERNLKEMYSNKNKRRSSKIIAQPDDSKKSNRIIGYYTHLIVDLLVKRPFGCEKISLELPIHINYDPNHTTEDSEDDAAAEETKN